MKGFVLKNAYWADENRTAQIKDLKREFKKLGVGLDVFDCDFFCQINENGGLSSAISKYDFCIFLDKDKYISEILEKTGLRLFNSSKAIAICDDKVSTFIALSNHNIPMPKTIPGLLCFHKEEVIPKEKFDKIEKEFGYPLIVKSSYGSLGSSVYKIDNRTELEEIMEKLKCRPHLFQRYVAYSYGRGLRIIVIGGKMTCGYMRKSETDFRSNLALGGKGYKVDIPKEAQAIAEKAAKVLKLDYCGVDVLFDKNGFKLCEVNSNAYFEGSKLTTGTNVAKAFAEYVVKTISSQKKE